MPPARQVVLGVVAIALLGWSLSGGPGDLVTRNGGPAELREGPLRFAAGVSPGDRAEVEAAIGAARPEAQALIDRVDGIVTVHVGAPPGGAAGVAEGSTEAYDVTLDLPAVRRTSGARGVSRLVLHELAHVVDHTLLPDDLKRDLDAGIPAGYPCPPDEPTGSCAAREERFAETFAKWAMNDIGVGIYLGYKVPPPASLDAWGAPLAEFASSAAR